MNHHHFEHIEHALGALEQDTTNTNVNESYYEKFKFDNVFLVTRVLSCKTVFKHEGTLIEFKHLL